MSFPQNRPTTRTEEIAALVGWCFSRLFSEARVLARMKLLAFASFLTWEVLPTATRRDSVVELDTVNVMSRITTLAPGYSRSERFFTKSESSLFFK